MKPHQSAGVEKRFILSIALTAFILAGEIIGGIWTGSLALLSDAAHVFMDIFALVLSFLALRLSARPPDDRHTYGWHRLEVLAALVNGITLILIALGIWREAFQRWRDPVSVMGLEMLVIAIIGLVGNAIVAFILHGQDNFHNHSHNHEEHAPGTGHKDLNVESAFLHVVGDALASVGVIAAGLVIWLAGWNWADALASALIGALILFNSVRLTRSALHILVEGTPAGLSLQEVVKEVQSVAGAYSVHDLHVWNICSGHIALSAHVVLEEGVAHPSEVIMAGIKNRLLHCFGIEHTTIQFETFPGDPHTEGGGC
ncbi:MAG: cation transporter [Anaerolineaceae bacterium]|nr:cation transporter [Anaerolineaceae bacterium]